MKNIKLRKFFLRPIYRVILKFGIDPRVILNFKYYPMFKRQKNEWLNSGGTISKNWMILTDYSLKAGIANGHYFHQDLLVANFIFEDNPPRHIDVGSRIDGFVAHVASFRKIEIIDIRPLRKSEHKNIEFIQANLLDPVKIEKTDSLSCLHTIEHFGLGRYSDPININGHVEGIYKLVDLVKKGGRLYISFPIGHENEIHFNAQRIFHPKWIFSIPTVSQKLRLLRFDYVDDEGDLHLNALVDEAVGTTNYGCGIYTFEKLI